MLDLHQLPSPPGGGQVTACECEGVLRAHDSDTALQLSQNMLGGGGPVLQAESNETVRPALGKHDAQHAFTAKPRLPASLAIAYREKGVQGLLEQISHQGASSESTVAHIGGCLAGSLLVGLRQLLALSQKISASPAYHASLERAYSSRTQTSSSGSNIICMCWHGVSRRLAVGCSDDSVRILSDKNLQPILKHKIQRSITQVYWLPNSMSCVCVACDAGVLIWSVDPASVVTRPSGACVTLLPMAHTAMPTVMHPHPLGTSLVSSNGRGVSIWDYAFLSQVRVQEGGSVTHVQHSPDGTYLLVVMQSPSTLRVFSTHDWTLTEWVCESAVSCCTWSECSQYVVFCTREPSMLYSVSPHLASNTATPLADLSTVRCTDADGDQVDVGGLVRGLAWGGERLVLLFHSCPYIVMFHTCTLHVLQLAVGGLIKGPDDCVPVTAAFHPAQPSLLTVVWSDNTLQHIPLVYTSRQTRTSSSSHRREVNASSLNVTATLNTTLAYAGIANSSPAPSLSSFTRAAGSATSPSGPAHNITTLGYGAANTPSASGHRTAAAHNFSQLSHSICSPIRNEYNNSFHMSNFQSPPC